VPVLRPGDSFPELAERVVSTPFQAVPVVDAEGRLLGDVGLLALPVVESDLLALPVVDDSGENG
jgi:hypothetical protein